MSASTDIRFDFGIGFESAASRVIGERAEREDLAKRELKYHVTFLDEIIGGILPHDLVLLGAETGVGKTELAKSIAMVNAGEGKRVHYFALEAEPREIERRIKYTLLSEFAHKDGRSLSDMTYANWYRGKCEHVVGEYNDRAETRIAKILGNLKTFYRGSSFGSDDIKRLLLAIQSETDLIILDHLHYVDIEDDNENRGFKNTIKMIRDVTLGMGKPMILIAHLRKRSGSSKAIVPDLEMFHGSSDIIKICTQAIMLAPARCMPAKNSDVANTFIHVPKDRMAGATGLIALCQFERRTRMYKNHYTLGRQISSGDGFQSIDDPPRWARHHKAIS